MPGGAASPAGRYRFPASRLPPGTHPTRGSPQPPPAGSPCALRPPPAGRRPAWPVPALAEDARPGGPGRGGGRAVGPRRSPRGQPRRRRKAGRDREVRLRLHQAPRSCPAPNTVANVAASGFMAKAPALLPLPPPPPPRAEVPVTRLSTPRLGEEEPRLHLASGSGRVQRLLGVWWG